jgi:enoyl-CoA hydratase/carnithine racemase
MSELVKYKKEGQVVTIMLANPPVNAVSTKVLTALNAAFDRAEKEADARVIIFGGEGEKAFCAGGDLREDKDFGDPVNARKFRTYGRETLNRIENGKLPIAAIHGYRIGGGTAGWVCDIRVAPGSVFRPPTSACCRPGNGPHALLPQQGAHPADRRNFGVMAWRWADHEDRDAN